MGKLLTFIGMLIFIDLLFFIFIDTNPVSLSSFIIGVIKSLAVGEGVAGLYSLISLTLIGGFIAAMAIAVGASILLKGIGLGQIQSFPEVAWATVAGTFFLSLLFDFIHIFNVLNAVHPPLTTFLALILMAPIIIIYALTVIEWIKNKD